MSNCYVTLFGCYFCIVHGWIEGFSRVRPVSRSAAEIILDNHPGAVIVEVSA